MTWWGWVLVWLGLFAGAGVLFFLLGRGLWQQARALVDEVGTANERLGAVMEQVDALGEQAVRARQDLAVFADPVALQREREAAARRKAREKDRRRRELLRARQRA